MYQRVDNTFPPKKKPDIFKLRTARSKTFHFKQFAKLHKVKSNDSTDSYTVKKIGRKQIIT